MRMFKDANTMKEEMCEELYDLGTKKKEKKRREKRKKEKTSRY